MKARVFLLFALLVVSNISYALNKTATGFYYPLESFSYSSSGTWLGPGLGTAGPHGHIGVDMLAPKGTAVYAIADGEVLSPSLNGWGAGNVGVWIKHMTASGVFVKVLYGHIDESTDVGPGQVKAGDVIGKLGSYTEPHLHFGAVDPGKEPEAPFGYTSDSDHNNFIDPIAFIESNKSVSSTCLGTLCGDAVVYHAKLRTAQMVRFGLETVSVMDVGWRPFVERCEDAQQYFYMTKLLNPSSPKFNAVPAPSSICSNVVQACFAQ